MRGLQVPVPGKRQADEMPRGARVEQGPEPGSPVSPIRAAIMQRVALRSVLTPKEAQEVKDIFRKPRKLAALAIFVILLSRSVWLWQSEHRLVDELMHAFDNGQDDRLSTLEMEAMLRANGVNITKDQLQSIFGIVDDEGDGYDEAETSAIVDMVSVFPKASSRIRDVAASHRSTYVDILMTIVVGGCLIYIVVQSDTLEKKFAASSFKNAVHFKRMQSQCSKLDDKVLELALERLELEQQITGLQTNSATDAREHELNGLMDRLKEINIEQEAAKKQFENEVEKWQTEAEKCMQEASRAKSKVEGIMNCMKGLEAFSYAGKGAFSKDGAQTGFCSSKGFSMDKITFGTIDNNVLHMFETSRRDKIGEGRDCAFRCTDLSSGMQFALKVYEFKDKHQRTSIQNDLCAYRTKVGAHPRIVSYERVIESESMIFVLMELIKGQDLFDIIATHGLTEQQARTLFLQLTEAIQHLHSTGVIHCDIKPENAMVIGDIASGDVQLKLIDFGCSCFTEYNQEAEGRVVHDMYMPPEHGEQSNLTPSVPTDMWRLGCTLFVMLTSKPPFASDQDTVRGIQARKTGNFHKDPATWSRLSEEAQDLIVKLLNGDPAKRPTTAEVLKHPWITGQNDG